VGYGRGGLAPTGDHLSDLETVAHRVLLKLSGRGIKLARGHPPGYDDERAELARCRQSELDTRHA